MKNLSNKTRIALIFALFISIIMADGLKAQSKLGVQVGASSNNYRYIMNYTDKQPTSAISGYGFGLFYEKSISSGLAITPIVNYARGGFRLDEENGSGSNQMLSKIDINKLETTILAKIKSPDGFMRPFFEIGPSISYTLKQESLPLGESGRSALDLDELGRVNASIVAGLGFETDLGPSTIEFYIRYEMGVGNLYNGEDETVTMRGNTLSFGTSIALFSFGKNKKTYCKGRKCI